MKDITQEAIALLDETISVILPPEALLKNDENGRMASDVEGLFLSVKNSPHMREQAKRIVIHQLDDKIKMVEHYDGLLELVPTEAIPEDKFEGWYKSWSDKLTHLMLLRHKVQTFQF